MHNWSIDEKKFKKENPKEYKLWRLSQLINYGLGKTKLNKNEIKKRWPILKTQIDPNTKVYFEYLLWGKLPSSKIITKNFWTL